MLIDFKLLTDAPSPAVLGESYSWTHGRTVYLCLLSLFTDGCCRISPWQDCRTCLLQDGTPHGTNPAVERLLVASFIRIRNPLYGCQSGLWTRNLHQIHSAVTMIMSSYRVCVSLVLCSSHTDGRWQTDSYFHDRGKVHHGWDMHHIAR